MRPAPKRLRQISLFESFSHSKKQKTASSDENMSHSSSEIREKLLAAAEKRMKSEVPVSNPSENEKPVVQNDSKGKHSMSPVPGCSKIGDQKNEEVSESDLENSADLFAEDQQSSEGLSSLPNSADLFPSGSDSGLKWDDVDEDSEELDQIALLNRAPDCSIPLPKLEPLENHSIMFSPHIRPGVAPRPYPSSYRDIWDSHHVRMPCSPVSKYPAMSSFGEKRIESRWNLICQSLKQDIRTSQDLEDAVLAYNSQYADRWNFQALHIFINEHYTEVERDYFFETILPSMVDLALELPNICTQPIPLLKKGKDHSVTLSQKQIGCLLLNAFFCTFPRRNMPKRSEYGSYPNINFNSLFSVESKKYARKVNRKVEKLKCLINYFRRIITEEPSGTLTFHRQYLDSESLPKWHQSTRGIRTAVIKSEGLIETDGYGMLQVDFANKYVGGGVLGTGCVQEEIRFVTCPELIVSKLFVECLGPTEVLIVTGVEQYNKYSGYSDNFKWEGDFRDQTPRDDWGRLYTQVVAMDAIFFTDSTLQFKPEFVRKELNKAYAGFYENALPPSLPAIATGNWGCGAFNGNSKLKFLIQLMAASEAGRNMLYFTFGNKSLKRDLKNMHTFLTDKNLSVGDVWRLLVAFAENLNLFSQARESELYNFIYSQFSKSSNLSVQKNDEEKISDSDKRAAEKLLDDIALNDSSTELEENTDIS